MINSTVVTVYVIGLAISVFICGVIYAADEFVHNRKPDLWAALDYEPTSLPAVLACLFWPATLALVIMAITVALLTGMGIGLVRLLVWMTKVEDKNEH